MRNDTEMLSLDELQRPIDQLRQQLADKGWTSYKTTELRDPTGQWTVRTGYVGGETYLYVSRFSQARFDQHVASVDPFEVVAHLRLWKRMDGDPSEAVRQVLADAGVPL